MNDLKSILQILTKAKTIKLKISTPQAFFEVGGKIKEVKPSEGNAISVVLDDNAVLAIDNNIVSYAGRTSSWAIILSDNTIIDYKFN